jgi:CRP/FNR family transcriptional regulator, cyclic AMP receptor protein
MTNPETLWYLESVNLYDILCPHKVKKMGDRHEFLHFKKDQFIFFPGECAEKIYMVVSGSVRIGHYFEDGKEMIKSILTNGDIFGELAVAGEEKRADFAQAMENGTTICPLSLEDLKALMSENNDLSLSILKFIGLRLRKLERKIEMLLFKDARTRIIEFLKEIAIGKGKKVGFETVIHLPFTHQDIAALTGTSRQTTTTILNKLRTDNLIYFDRKRILIRDLDRLNQLSN